MTSEELSSLYTASPVIRLTKLSGVARRTSGIFIGYWLEGLLSSPITIGEPITVLRHRRSRRDDDPMDGPEAVECMGLFESSKIVSIEQNLLYTENSVWQIEEVAGIPAVHPTAQFID